jgi:hypothetical protein
MLSAHFMGAGKPGELSRYSHELNGLVRFPAGQDISFYPIPQRQALWTGQPLVQWVRRALSQGYRGRSVKLTTHLPLVSRSRMMEPYLHFPIHLYGVVIN